LQYRADFAGDIQGDAGGARARSWQRISLQARVHVPWEIETSGISATRGTVQLSRNGRDVHATSSAVVRDSPLANSVTMRRKLPASAAANRGDQKAG
jgi:hypothetical protein